MTPRTGLADLAVLAFLASLAFMSLEMVAGRLVTRHLGSSIYGWSSVIAVLLAGLSLGNFLGGKIADFISNEKQASWLFLLASILTLLGPPAGDAAQVVPRQVLRPGAAEVAPAQPRDDDADQLPGGAGSPADLAVPVLLVVTAMFFLPSLSMGTVSPVVAKLAVDRLRRFKRTGTAIGQVYAWGMVGSILGTFLTGFVLIDYLGTKGVVLVLGTSWRWRRRSWASSSTPSGRASRWASASSRSRRRRWVDVFSQVFPSINGQSSPNGAGLGRAASRWATPTTNGR